MKKLLVITLAVIMLTGIAAAQSQLENPGFEQWDDILVGGGDTIREPVNWSSLKTSDNPQLSSMAPVVCKRSSNAHTGKYSVQLTNVLSFVVANGVVTNGRIHPNIITSESYMYTDTLDGQWNTPFTARPDSVVGWFKYAPQSDDTFQVKVILHKGFGKQPDTEYMDHWTGVAEYKSPLNTGSNWVRFSKAFTYYNDDAPEYVLVILNSGNGFFPAAGSIVYFDDLEMIYNSPQNSLNDRTAPSGFIYTIDNRYLVMKGLKETNFQTVTIRDLTGKLVWAGQPTADRIDISSAHLKKGIYLVTFTGKVDVYTQKILLH